MTAKLFALDHNFPPTILVALTEYIPEALLVPIGEIDARMPLLEDWQVLVALMHHSRKWTGLITNDGDFASEPREIAALIQTKLAVVIAEAAGHDMIKATGLLLAHLPGMCRRLVPGTAQLWQLRSADRSHQKPRDVFNRVAHHRKREPAALLREHGLSSEELETNPLKAP